MTDDLVLYMTVPDLKLRIDAVKDLLKKIILFS